ncbi:TauD/TfdA family dioxygenase [Sesbania bispinosa]|nr:TauD/TfdA family dioxygenase [Sesbania bispinosa]
MSTIETLPHLPQPLSPLVKHKIKTQKNQKTKQGGKSEMERKVQRKLGTEKERREVATTSPIARHHPHHSRRCT